MRHSFISLTTLRWGRGRVRGRGRVKGASLARGRAIETLHEPVPEHDDAIEQQTKIGTLGFDDTTGDKAYDFLTECQDRLFNLGILEAHGMLILLISSHEWPRSGKGRYSLVGQLVLVTPRAYTLNVIGTREPFLIPKKTLGLAT
uniref:Uncharacterized protein n=1 Tax=Solanum tuberosum TaxID=4113 RepID=M1DWP0_SOLTU